MRDCDEAICIRSRLEIEMSNHVINSVIGIAEFVIFTGSKKRTPVKVWLLPMANVPWIVSLAVQDE